MPELTAEQKKQALAELDRIRAEVESAAVKESKGPSRWERLWAWLKGDPLRSAADIMRDRGGRRTQKSHRHRKSTRRHRK